MRDKRLDNRPTADHELLIIRVGHHLWWEWKSKHSLGWPKGVVWSALQDVWDAKEQIRVPLRKEWLEYYDNRSKRLKENRPNV